MSKRAKPIPLVVKVAWGKNKCFLKCFEKETQWSGGDGINLVK
jgi:hypothetical protein